MNAREKSFNAENAEQEENKKIFYNSASLCVLCASAVKAVFFLPCAVGHGRQSGRKSSKLCTSGPAFRRFGFRNPSTYQLLEKVMPLSNRLAAEFFGTFWLVLGGCGSAVLAASFPGLGIRTQQGGRD